MTEPTELLACPFCGDSGPLDFQDGSTHRWGVAYCAECGASAGETRREYPDVGDWHAKAIVQWNTRTPQPSQAQAGAVPLTDIRKAALDLYTPPFRHEYGYIRDANHQMVADDAGSEGTGLITSRIRGWGRIQYMDKPEQRAAALQDEVAEIVAEALNAYWSIHGIKGGQHGTE